MIEEAVNWFNNLFYTKTGDWVFGWLEKNQVPEEGDRNEIVAEEDYITLKLKSMRIVNVRAGLDKFYGVLHSYNSVIHPSTPGKIAEFNTIISPDALKNVDAKHIDNVVNLDRIILGPIPYYGILKLQLGLFSVKCYDLLAKYTELLESVSSIAGVAFVSTALPYIQPIKQGISLLTHGDQDSILEIGLSREFDTLKSGWFLVMRAPAEEINIRNLKVTPHNFQLIDKYSEKQIKDYPYMICQIQSSKQRPDWRLIPEIIKSYNELMDIVRSGDLNRVKESLSSFRRIVYTSPDLVFSDAKTLYAKVESKVNDIFGPSNVECTLSIPEPMSLDDIDIYEHSDQ